MGTGRQRGRRQEGESKTGTRTGVRTGNEGSSGDRNRDGDGNGDGNGDESGNGDGIGDGKGNDSGFTILSWIIRLSKEHDKSMQAFVRRKCCGESGLRFVLRPELPGLKKVRKNFFRVVVHVCYFLNASLLSKGYRNIII